MSKNKEMRTIDGKIKLPSNCPFLIANQLILEILDTSLIDAPSEVVHVIKTSNVSLEPNGFISFHFTAPEVTERKVLSLKVQIYIQEHNKIQKGDLLSVQHYPIANTGNVGNLVIEVKVI